MKAITPVAVTGMGIICSIGNNVNEFSQSLQLGRSGIKYLTRKIIPTISVNIGAEIDGFSFETLLKRHKENGSTEEIIKKAGISAWRSPFAIQAAVISAIEAWQEAKLHKKIIEPRRIGVIVGGNNTTQKYTYDFYQKFFKSPEYLNPRYPLHYLDTDHVGTISEIFNIQGEGFSVGGASASGNTAIIKGWQLINSGIVDVCLVLGTLAELSPMELQGYFNLGAMGGKKFHDKPDKACRPFDQEHEGFIYGQSSACIILESLDSANNRNVPILAEILSGAIQLAGNRLTDPSLDGEVKAMKSAIKFAGIKPNSIQYLNSHGTSSPLGDEVEIKATKTIFRENLSQLWINSTKGLTGHCLFSAGVTECISSIIQMQLGFVHPNINLENSIDNECRFCGKLAEPAIINISMSNSFGFGGIQTSLIIKKGGKKNEGRN